MRTLLIPVTTAACLFVFGGHAQAQNYPWCANYEAGIDGGGTNCGFTTFEQCMATLSGIGGFCDRNTQYVAPAGPRPRHKYNR